MTCMNSNLLMNKWIMIKKYKILYYFVLVIIFQVFSSCKTTEPKFNGTVYKLSNDNYGYEINYNNKIVVKQEVIPAITGNRPFSDSLSALKVMDLVLEKLNTGNNPTISKKDLMALNIIK